jgi:DNA sulfur modification protein DndD
MIIKNIKISNFRSYFGLTNIDFNVVPDKNITLISGKNGFGKTSFLTSLIWGFYGKLMSKVEYKYKKEITGSGGYQKYIRQQFNRNQKKEDELRVEITISDVMIPSIPCENITIIRTFNVTTLKENLEILIDGDYNELTKKVGYETFINDFILPREIAKFFFFDSEKIVSLAEAKTKDELKSLSSAYSEVLGLKKYDDLKQGLKSLVSTLKRRGVKDTDLKKLNALIQESESLKQEIEFNDETTEDTNNQIESLKIKSDNLQEKLIREGATISLNDFKDLKSLYAEKQLEIKEVRKKLNDVLEFIPFMLSGNIFQKLIKQVNKEISSGLAQLNEQTVEELNNVLKKILKDSSKEVADKYVQEFNSELKKVGKENKTGFLLDYSDESYRTILAVDNNIKNSLRSRYTEIIKKEKDLRFELNKILKKTRSFENKNTNPLNEKYRAEKHEIDSQIEKLLVKKGELNQVKLDLVSKSTVLNKQISQLENKEKLIGEDRKKLAVTLEVLEKIETITNKIKIEKKHSLERSILLGMNSLMHKVDFIEKVRIELYDDYLDINLVDKDNNVIDKESLSKGEQQLYATSILKSLVEESGISFPIFVDSPLQKFDKDHSKNIIKKFYPSISKQVVLLPLLEKELTFDEFKMMESNVSALYKIINKNGDSKIVEFDNKSFLND